MQELQRPGQISVLTSVWTRSKLPVFTPDEAGKGQPREKRLVDLGCAMRCGWLAVAALHFVLF